MANERNGKEEMFKKQMPFWMHVATSILVAWLLALTSWGASNIINSREEIVAIKANSFTATDGAEVWKELNRIQTQTNAELSKIRELIAALPKEVPPDWFEAKVERLEAANAIEHARIFDKLSDLDHKIDALK